MAQTSSPETSTTPTDGHPSPLPEREQRMRADYDWVLHDAAVQRQYAGTVVAVSSRTVWGAGRTPALALQAALAQPGCPSREEIALVPVEGCTIDSARSAAPRS